ncbi:glycosyltransferase family 4 protein [Methylogaea oryzae]|uniref:UDP-glucose--(Heptosyl) LPS alpha 1,3-glucosyltransferase WaaG n=1 Tax=Methylogaea oryzae TaxID=1295382 RepID=A0A8D4VM38_9GAMM|nr:glycosyltransferase family 4 protein [Methylogaea oryzae]BBL69632.1 UDP-glucose--(heptosyl) LPS alpha 1,3-glucosyltransferase WaaG [Methylogaea oryzae]
MKLAFALFKYFPYGGLQRDFIRIAGLCRDRGHEIHVYTLAWEGAVPSGFQVHVVKPRFALSYYGKNLALLRALRQARKTERFDAVVGFNKLPGLDVYYAADPCYAARLAEKGWLHRLTPRHRQFAAFERAVFAPKAGVEVLMIAPSQIDHFIAAYGTPAERFHLLPPPINRDRIAPPNAAVLRKNWRWDTGVAPDERVVLMIASAFRIKGVDRALLAMAALPQDVLAKTRLFVVGGDDAAPYQRQAQALGIAKRVVFCGARDDVPRFLLGADLLLHPAYTENTGTVLLEAMVAGLPVLTTDICGYAFHVLKANAGRVVPSPFEQAALNRELAEMLSDPQRLKAWGGNGIAYGRTEDLYSLPEKAADLIETVARKN